MATADSVSDVVATTDDDVKEISVPVPWGHIATKCWNMTESNSSLTRPVVCLHGWQDNANTFDRLLPLLSKRIPFICVDAAGHGKSSARPPGTPDELTMHVWDLKRVLDHFGLDSGVTLLGHSKGGATALLFAATFPEVMHKCITLDAPALFPKKAAAAPASLADAIRKHLAHERKNQQPPRYTYNEAMERFLSVRIVQMKESSAMTLMDRGLKQLDEVNAEGEPLFEFARDYKVTFPALLGSTIEQCAAFLKKIDCHLFLITFKDNFWATLEAFDGKEDWFAELESKKELAFAVYQQNCKSFKFLPVEGAHHTHLDFPERISDELNEFLIDGHSTEELEL